MTPYLNADTSTEAETSTFTRLRCTVTKLKPHMVGMKKHHPVRNGLRCRDSIVGGATRAPGAPDTNFDEVSESFL